MHPLDASRTQEAMGNVVDREIEEAEVRERERGELRKLVSDVASRVQWFYVHPSDENKLRTHIHKLHLLCKFFGRPPRNLVQTRSLSLGFLINSHAKQRPRDRKYYDFVVVDLHRDINMESKTLFVTVAYLEGRVGVVAFLHPVAAMYAKLYVSLFCPRCDLFDNSGVRDVEVPPLSDLLGHTFYGPWVIRKQIESKVEPRLVRVNGMLSEFTIPGRANQSFSAYVNTTRNILAEGHLEDWGDTSSGRDRMTQLVTVSILKVVHMSDHVKDLVTTEAVELRDSVIDLCQGDHIMSKIVSRMVHSKALEFAMYKYVSTSEISDDRSAYTMAVLMCDFLLEDVLNKRVQNQLHNAIHLNENKLLLQEKRIDEMISACAAGAISSVKRKLAIERHEYLLALERGKEKEEERRRRKILEDQRRERAMRDLPQNPAPLPPPPAQAPRDAYDNRQRGGNPPAEVDVCLRAARIAKAVEHQKSLQKQEEQRIAELEERALIATIGYAIARGD